MVVGHEEIMQTTKACEGSAFLFIYNDKLRNFRQIYECKSYLTIYKKKKDFFYKKLSKVYK